MSEDNTNGVRPDEHHPQILLYDFFKFLTTLSILILGGVLSLTASDREVPIRSLVLIVGLLATAGVMAISGAERIVRGRLKGQPLSRSTQILQMLSMALLGAGTGAFLSIWLEE